MKPHEIIAKLSPAQLKLLERACRQEPYTIIHNVYFKTGEALRRLDLMERDSTRVTERVFADKDGIHVQVQRPGGYWMHDWYLTRAGVIVASHLPKVQ